MSPAAGQTVTQYTVNTGAITANTELKIICGDVTSNFTITATGDHASVTPTNASVYKGSDYEVRFVPTDTSDYRYIGVTDNNVTVTS